MSRLLENIVSFLAVTKSGMSAFQGKTFYPHCLLPVLCLLWLCAHTACAETPTTYGPIKSGDMLWSIAGKVRPNRNLSRYQVMQALLQANPQAFYVPCNMQSLKIGVVLQIPSADTMRAFSHNQAVQAVKQQETAWRAYRRSGKTIQCPEPKPITPLSVAAEAKTQTAVSTIATTVIPSQSTSAASQLNNNPQAINPAASPIVESPSRPATPIVPHPVVNLSTIPLHTDSNTNVLPAMQSNAPLPTLTPSSTLPPKTAMDGYSAPQKALTSAPVTHGNTSTTTALSDTPRTATFESQPNPASFRPNSTSNYRLPSAPTSNTPSNQFNSSVTEQPISSSNNPPSPANAQQVDTLSLPIPLWLGVVILVGLFLLSMLVGGVLYHLSNKKKLASSTPPNPRNPEPPPSVPHSTATKSTAFALASDHAPHSPVTPATNSNAPNLQEKLSSVRTYLAEGEVQAIQTILQDVLANGSKAQQAEARQLLEINKKMHPRVTEDNSVVDTVEHDDTALNALVETRQQMPTPVQLPDNEAKLFELIDKIFALLDHELNAQGKLVEAYHQRQQHTQPSDVVDTQVNVEKTIQRESTPSRYL